MRAARGKVKSRDGSESLDWVSRPSARSWRDGTAAIVTYRSVKRSCRIPLLQVKTTTRSTQRSGKSPGSWWSRMKPGVSSRCACSSCSPRRTSTCRPIGRVDNFLQVIQQPVLVHCIALPLFIETFVEALLLDYITDVEVDHRGLARLQVGMEEGRV